MHIFSWSKNWCRRRHETVQSVLFHRLFSGSNQQRGKLKGNWIELRPPSSKSYLSSPLLDCLARIRRIQLEALESIHRRIGSHYGNFNVHFYPARNPMKCAFLMSNLERAICLREGASSSEMLENSAWNECIGYSHIWQGHDEGRQRRSVVGECGDVVLSLFQSFPIHLSKIKLTATTSFISWKASSPLHGSPSTQRLDEKHAYLIERNQNRRRQKLYRVCRARQSQFVVAASIIPYNDLFIGVFVP